MRRGGITCRSCWPAARRGSPICPWLSRTSGSSIGTDRRRKRRRRHGRASGDPMVLLGCWLVGGTLLLSLAHSKLVTYLWPVFPAVAILAAVAWARLWEGTLSPPARRLLGGVFWMTCLVGPAVLPAALRGGPGATRPVAAAGGPLGSHDGRSPPPAGFPWDFGSAGDCGPRWPPCAVVVAVHFVFIMTIVMPRVGRRGFGPRSGRLFQPPRPVAAAIAGGRGADRLGGLLPRRAASRGLRDEQLRSVALGDIFDPRVAGRRSSWPWASSSLPAAEAQAARLAGLPYERAGRWRLYRAGELSAWRNLGSAWK